MENNTSYNSFIFYFMTQKCVKNILHHRLMLSPPEVIAELIAELLNISLILFTYACIDMHVYTPPKKLRILFFFGYFLLFEICHYNLIKNTPKKIISITFFGECI